MDTQDVREKVHNMMEVFRISDEKLKEVSRILRQEFDKGLVHEESSCMKMLPSYVRDIPDGTEEGKFLALDLGGSKFRVLLIVLKGKNYKMEHEIYDISEEYMTGTGDSLFDHITNCLSNFVTKHNLSLEVLPLGFTFSFPCQQKSLTEAILIRWTKGFKCSGVEGKDVVKLLRDAITRQKDVNIDVVAVVNDTTGTLMSCAHKNSNCRVGVIVGTGTNACYMEKLENVEKWTGDTSDPARVIINCEWGAFGDNGCIDFLRTEIDRKIDEDSINPGEQLFEKMISGMYMGEIVRRVIVQFSREGVFDSGSLSKAFSTPYTFKSKYVSFIERDMDGKKATVSILKKLGIETVSDNDVQVMQIVCSAVSTRAAHLVGAGIATILNKMKRDFTTVGVDGSVYRYHPLFKSKMQQKISELSDYKFELMLSEDGSGRGAALVAAVACRQEKEQKKNDKRK